MNANLRSVGNEESRPAKGGMNIVVSFTNGGNHARPRDLDVHVKMEMANAQRVVEVCRAVCLF